MKRRKNLERAIVLGLLLSTSVYGSAWAIDVTESSYVMQSDKYIEGWDGKIPASESFKNLTVSDETAESIFKYGVLVTADVKGKDNPIMWQCKDTDVLTFEPLVRIDFRLSYTVKELKDYCNKNGIKYDAVPYLQFTD